MSTSYEGLYRSLAKRPFFALSLVEYNQWPDITIFWRMPGTRMQTKCCIIVPKNQPDKASNEDSFSSGINIALIKISRGE